VSTTRILGHRGGIAAVTEDSLHVLPLGADLGSNGAYRLQAGTGLLAGVAAGSATAGHVFAFRWAQAGKFAVIERAVAKWRTIAGFTAAQEVGLDLVVARGYAALHTGGTAIPLAGDAFKKRTTHGTSNANDVRIGTTAALSAPNGLVLSQLGADGFAELAAGITTPKGFFNVEFAPEFPTYPLVLAAGEGLIVRNLVAMGAGGTARVYVEVDWREVDAYPQ